MCYTTLFRSLVDCHVCEIQVLHIEARKVARVALNWKYLAAAQGGIRHENVDIALDVHRDGRADPRRIKVHDQADRDVLLPERFREPQGTERARRVPDQDDWRGIAAIFADRVPRDDLANGEGENRRWNAGGLDACGQA